MPSPLLGAVIVDDEELARSGGRVSIVVENPAEAGAEKPAGTGLGLANVRRRVAACWGDAGYVGARLHDGLFRVEIEVPAEA